jgi:connector enhancer of kinase suppressor of Ras 2
MKKKEGVGLTAKTWSKRWFVLSHKSLYYYKTEQDEKAEGVIYLPGFQISPAPEIKTKKFAFKAHHTGTTFYFAAERQDDMAKWMNKLGLASLSDLVLGDFVQTAGFWKPDQLRPVKSASNLEVSHMDSKISNFCYSESEESLTSLSERPSPAASVSNSREDLSDLLRNIRRADLDIAGANVRDRRSTVLLGLRSEVDSEYDVCWRRLLSLNRTIKDKEQTLSAVEEFLSSEPITSERLKRFIQQHPHIASPQQPTESVYDDSRSTDSTDLVDGGVPASDSNSTLDNDDEPADNCV